MNITDIIVRVPTPGPWEEGEKIPWDEPQFSARMLLEHLSQDHDLASRRFGTVDRHVAWIHQTLLKGRPSAVLDLGCGPGLYTSRLAALGHSCVGIDFSPASVEYAMATAARDGLGCRYLLGDIRTTAFGAGYDLVMLVYGELNTFRPEEARGILAKGNNALKDGGVLLLELTTPEALRVEGSQGRTWYSERSGLFSDRPHLCLVEHSWDGRQRVATTRYFVVESDGQVTRYAESHQAYTQADLERLLMECGFEGTVTYPAMTGEGDAEQTGLVAVVARRPV